MAEQWYYKLQGKEFGPVRFDVLRQLSTNGKLESGDQVREGDAGGWVVARTVAGLFSTVKASSGSTAEEMQSLEELNDLSDFVIDTEPQAAPIPPRREVAVAAPPSPPVDEDDDFEMDGTSVAAPPPAPPPEPEPEVVTDEWYCRVSGEEYGPISFDELTQWVSEGRLDENDRVKLGAQGKWRGVDAVPELAEFHKPAAPEPAPKPEPRPSRAASPPPAEPPPPRVSEPPKFVAAAPAPTPAPAKKPSKMLEAAMAAESAAVAKEARSGPSFFSRINPKSLGALVVVVVGLVWVFMPHNPNWGDKEAYNVLSGLATELKQQRTKGIDNAFATRVGDQVSPIITRLKKKSDDEDPANLCLKWAAEYMIEALKDKTTKPTRQDALVDKYLAEAKKLMEQGPKALEPPPPPPPPSTPPSRD